MKNFLLLCALGMILSASTCNKNIPMNLNDIPDLKDTRWVLTKLGGEAISLPDGAEAFLMMNPEDNSINGNGGCNKLFGGLNLEGDKLSFKDIGGTKKYCEGSMDVENGFMDALRNTTNFSLAEDGGLDLLGSGGTALASLAKVAP